MSDQHKYTSAVTVTENAARIKRITLLPNYSGSTRNGLVEVVYSIGEDQGGGVFVETDSKTTSVMYEDLSAAIQATLDDLEDKALAHGETAGVYPVGSNEVI